jgi:hypothetical protein
MEVTKETVLESMNTYCTERKYGSENLTDGFKEKFSNFFVKKYEGKDVEQEEMIADLHFNLDTAFSASVDINSALKSSFETKKTEYENQIAELNKKLGKKNEQQKFEVPKELQDQLDELKKYKNEEVKKTKFASIMDIAKKGIRQDLHKSFETFATGTNVDLEKTDKEQADALVSRFQEIFKDSIGDIKPLAPQQVRKNDEAVLSGLKRVKV